MAILVGAAFLVSGMVFGRAGTSIWLTGAAVVVFVGSILLDTYVTAMCLSLKSQYDSRGLWFPIAEANPLLPEFPTVRQLIWSWPSLVGLMVLPLVVIFPLFGFSLALAVLIVVMGNLRRRKRMIRELTLFDYYQSQEMTAGLG
jgi:hypothetical protein